MAYNVKFYAGAAKPATVDPNAFYYINNQDLYLGNIKLSNGADLVEAIGRISVNEGDIDAIQKTLNDLTGGDSGAGSIASQLASLKTELQEEISAGDAAVTAKVTAEENRAKGAESTLQGNIDELSGTVADNKQASETEDARLAGLIADNAEDIGEIRTTAAENTAAISAEETARKNADDALSGRINTEKGRIDTLIGSDVNASVREIALAVLSEQLLDNAENGATDNFKTLQELADWLEQHPEDAAAMNQAINDNADAIAANTRLIESNKSATDNSISNLQGQITSNDEDITGIKSRLNDIEETIEDEITNGGILADAKEYTNTELNKVSELVQGNAGDISALTQRVAKNEGDIATHGTNIGTNASNIESLTSKISTLVGSHTGKTLGTAAFESKDAFEPAGAVAALETSLTNYVDTALTWNSIQ